MKFLFSVLFAATSLAMLSAQPVVSPGGIVNAASYTPIGLPGSGIAQGSLFIVFGSGLGPSALLQSGAYPLPLTLGGSLGTSIQITSGGKTFDAPLIYASAGQLAAIMPSATLAGTASIVVTYQGKASAPVSFTVVPNSFGIFSSNQAGSGPGIVTDVNYKVFGQTTAANPGDAAILWGTGLGPVQGDEAAGALPGDLPSIPVELYIGAQKASISYRGRSGCCAGLDQIVFTVPSVTGCHVPVTLKINDTVSNFTSVSIAPVGVRVCSDPGGPSAADLARYVQQGSFSIGGISLLRLNSSLTVPTLGDLTTSIDTGNASFYRYLSSQFDELTNPFSVATTGTCSVYSFKGSATQPPIIMPVLLDAGNAITVTGPNGTKEMTKATGPAAFTGYSASFGTTSTGAPGAGFLDAGSYKITGPGGTQVGPFSVSLTLPAPLVWTNQSSVTTVTRSAGQLITWTGGDPSGTVQMTGTSIDATGSNASGAGFICYAKTSDGQFTIPAYILLSLPVSAVESSGGVNIGTGGLIVGSVATPVSFTATGLDTATAVSLVEAFSTVNYK